MPPLVSDSSVPAQPVSTPDTMFIVTHRHSRKIFFSDLSTYVVPVGAASVHSSEQHRKKIKSFNLHVDPPALLALTFDFVLRRDLCVIGDSVILKRGSNDKVEEAETKEEV